MRDPLPESIDPGRLLGEEDGLSGIWPAARCQPALQTTERMLTDVTIDIVATDTGRGVKLDGRIRAELELVCQRCLRAMDWTLDDSIKLLLVRPGQAVSESEGYEVLELDEHGHIGTAEWIEEEIILRIPGIPVHSRNQDCDPDILRRAWEFEQNAEAAGNVKDNPFKVLEGWKDRQT